MAKVKIYNFAGQVVGDLSLADALFAVKVNPTLVHEAVIAQEANYRIAIAHTKLRGEVAGSGKKPWRQKGTGRARHGSVRSPIWVGGGVTFGPRSDRNFSKKMNRVSRRNALAMVLSDKVANDSFLALENLAIPEGKTKTLAQALRNLPNSKGKTLLVVEPGNRLAVRAARNLPDVTAISAKSLNVVDLLTAGRVVASKEAVEVMTLTYQK
jgi:large subunit ribosomal protein L4